MATLSFRQTPLRITAAIDVGGSKVSCLIASRKDSHSAPVILGMGHHGIRSLKKGEALTLDVIESAILHAVQKAEKQAGLVVKEAVVNISGTHLLSELIKVSSHIQGHRVADHDIRQLVNQGTKVPSNSSFTVLHVNPVQFSVDKGPFVHNPRGMYGTDLIGYLHVVTGELNPTRTLVHCLQRCHIQVKGLVPSAIASGLATLVEDERELGVILIDFGSHHTHVAVFREGEVVHTDCITIGSSHITSDLAHGLSTSLGAAERIKILYGSAIETTDDLRVMVEVPQLSDPHREQTHRVPRSLVTSIIKPRVEEIFELVRQKLSKNDVAKMASRRVVLTGGGSQLPGLRELAQTILQKQVRLGKPLEVFQSMQSYAIPPFATCAGLLTFAFGQNYAGNEPQSSQMPWMRSLVAWFKDNF